MFAVRDREGMGMGVGAGMDGAREMETGAGGARRRRGIENRRENIGDATTEMAKRPYMHQTLSLSLSLSLTNSTQEGRPRHTQRHTQRHTHTQTYTHFFLSPKTKGKNKPLSLRFVWFSPSSLSFFTTQVTQLNLHSPRSLTFTIFHHKPPHPSSSFSLTSLPRHIHTHSPFTLSKTFSHSNASQAPPNLHHFIAKPTLTASQVNPWWVFLKQSFF